MSDPLYSSIAPARPGTLRTVLRVAIPAAAFALTFAVLIAIHGSGPAPPDDDSAEIRRLREVIALLRDRYVLPVDEETLVRSALDGMLSALDPYCEYYDSEQRETFTEETMGEYSGIGVVMRVEDESLVVHSVLPGGPADVATVRAGERLVGVDGERLPERVSSLRSVERRVKGRAGTSVVLSLRSDLGERDVTVLRGELKKTSVPAAAMLDEDARVGYVRIRAFQEGTARDFDEAARDLLAAGMRSLVLDLRFNPGGVLHSAVDVADRFLPEGANIVSTRGRTDASNVPYDAKAGNDLLDGIAVAVLVNGESASAAEVLAGALQDHRRALLVGTKTYGKGLVQSVETLSDRATLLKFTSARYFTPAGRCIDRRMGFGEEIEAHGGIVPDFVVRLPSRRWKVMREAFSTEEIRTRDGAAFRAAAAARLIDEENDTQLAAALRLLRGEPVVQVFRKRPPPDESGPVAIVNERAPDTEVDLDADGERAGGSERRR